MCNFNNQYVHSFQLLTVKYGQREKESYGGNKKEWMDGVHYVNTFVRLMNVCTVSTISMCSFLVNNCNVI